MVLRSDGLFYEDLAADFTLQGGFSSEYFFHFRGCLAGAVFYVFPTVPRLAVNLQPVANALKIPDIFKLLEDLGTSAALIETYGSIVPQFLGERPYFEGLARQCSRAVVGIFLFARIGFVLEGRPFGDLEDGVLVGGGLVREELVVDHFAYVDAGEQVGGDGLASVAFAVEFEHAF